MMTGSNRKLALKWNDKVICAGTAAGLLRRKQFYLTFKNEYYGKVKK